MRVGELIGLVRQIELDSTLLTYYLENITKAKDYLRGEIAYAISVDGYEFLCGGVQHTKREVIVTRCVDAEYVIDLKSQKIIVTASEYISELSAENSGREFKLATKHEAQALRRKKERRRTYMPVINVDATLRAIQEVNGDDIKLAVLEQDAKNPNRTKLRIYSNGPVTDEDYESTKNEFANILTSVGRDCLDFDVQDIRGVRIDRPKSTPRVKPLDIFDRRKEFK